MQLELGVVPLVMIQVKPAWAALANDARLAWLNNKLAQLTEFQIPPSGVVWVDGKANEAGDMVMMLWNLVDEEAVDALLRTMRQDDVLEHFNISLAGGPVAMAQEPIFAPFLRS